jgi:LSD1 subclass zinc finger protein
LEVSSKLIEMLVCPVCKTPVKLTSDSQGLRCASCQLIYPIRDGFPVMIKDEARPDSGAEAPSGH